jgi:DNA-binding NtrC family response regulator
VVEETRMSFKELQELLSEVSPPKPDSERVKIPTQRPVVLIVDDDAIIRQSLDFALSEHYELILCASAMDGLRVFSGDVCAVVLDVKMRGHDGFWMCDELRKVEPGIPIIFYSAFQDLKNPFDIINTHRPFGYIVKDNDPTKLLNTLETATRLFQSTLRSRRIIEQLKRRRSQPPP